MKATTTTIKDAIGPYLREHPEATVEFEVEDVDVTDKLPPAIGPDGKIYRQFKPGKLIVTVDPHDE